MYYKLEFDSKKAEWALFINNLLFWHRVKGRSFKTYEEAEAYIQSTGFDKAYVRKNYRQHLNSLDRKAPTPQPWHNYGTPLPTIEQDAK